jgi:hypothetical protein
MYLPGYFAFLEGESGTPPNAILYQIFTDSLYAQLLGNEPRFFLDGFTVFSNRVYRNVQNQNIQMSLARLIPYIKHFWNRQFVIQIILIPTKLKYYHFSVPLHRNSTSFNIQADIMYLAVSQRRQGYKYLVVIIETYSRFLWVKPLRELRANHVTAKIREAFNRPGLANAFYLYLRDKVHEITIDGGSEFRGIFPNYVNGLFTNQNNQNQVTAIRVAKPKYASFGRPDRTGPVEAGNRMLRRVLRDYQIGITRQFLYPNNNQDDGLGPLLNTYNERVQIQNLHNHSPAQVANALMTGNIPLITLLDHSFQQKKDKKIAIQQAYQEQYPIITNVQMGYAYRLILERSAFPKQVDFRMGVHLYIITTYNSLTVNLKKYYFPNAATLPEERDVPWKRLVLVKVPIDFGPTGTGANSMLNRVLQLQTNNRQFIPP